MSALLVIVVILYIRDANLRFFIFAFFTRFLKFLLLLKCQKMMFNEVLATF